MSDEIFFDGKRYISANEAGISAGFTRDYVARLCRDGKISGRRVGTHWYVEQASLKDFLVTQEYAKSRRSESLTEERIREYHDTTPVGFVQEDISVHAPSSPVKSPEFFGADVLRLPRFAGAEAGRNEIETKTSALASPWPTSLNRGERDGSSLAPAVAHVSRVISSRADEIKNKMAVAVARQSRDGHGQAKLLSSMPGGFAHAALTATHVPVYTLTPLTEFFHKVVALALTLMLTFGTYAAVDPSYARFAADSVQENVNAALDSYHAATGGGLGVLADRTQSQVAAVAENPASAMLAVRGAVTLGLPRVAANFARSLNENVNNFVYAIAFPAALVFSQSFVDSSKTGSVAVEITPSSDSGVLSSQESSASTQASARTQTTPANTINNPVIERVVETTRLLSVGGISEELLDKKLAELDSKLSSRALVSSAANSTNITNIYASAASVARIEHLDALDLTNPTITGGSITEASISAADSLSVVGDTSLATTTVNGDLTVTGAVNFTGSPFSATDATFTNATSTNATSTNSYISNLGAVTASTTNLTWVNATGTNSTSTNFYSASFTADNATTTNLFSTNASTTNATSTNLFSVLANFTTGIISTLTATAATITSLIATTISGTDLTYTNATTPNATSTNSYISNLGAVTASTTNLTWVNATGTAATTTSLFSTTASSTNLFSTNGNIGILSAGTLSLTGSTTLQDFTFVNATGTSATTTNLYTTNFNAANSTSTNLFATSGSTTNSTSKNLYASAAVLDAATSTSLFSPLARLTTGIVDALTSTLATITGLTVTNSTTTNATSTNAFNTNLVATNATSTNLYASAAAFDAATSTSLFSTTASSTNLYSTNGSIGVLSAGTLTLSTDLAVTEGGTGASTLTGLLQGNGASAFTAITDSSTVGQLLRVTGASTYAWGALDLSDTDAITGDLPFANLTQVAANSVLGNITGATGDVASLATSSLFTWTGTGDVVRGTSPTLVTPALGTPYALTLTNATGLLPAGMNLTKGNFLVGT